MKILHIVLIALLFSACTESNFEASESESENGQENQDLKSIESDLPTIGLLAYDGVLMTEVTAPMDVFTKKDTLDNSLFNVIVISESSDPIKTEEGLKIVPDFTFENCPVLNVLFVPSAYDMSEQIKNENIINFIREQDEKTEYIVSNCAGAQLIGASGIADGKKIVTWIGGGEQLQKDFPNLKVQNDALTTYVSDGKFSSSNGNLATYISSLELLEKLTSREHRLFVESYLYLDRLSGWQK